MRDELVDFRLCDLSFRADARSLDLDVMRHDRGKNDNGNRTHLRVFLDPTGKRKAVETRHLDIRHEKGVIVGGRVEMIPRVFPVPHQNDVMEPSLREDVLQLPADQRGILRHEDLV